MKHFKSELTISKLLQQRAENLSSKCALRFLHNGTHESENLTFTELFDWSNEIAIGLSKLTKPGDRVILSFPAGLEFIACFYACMKIGVIAVPVAHPSNRKHHWMRVKGISDDCSATLLLTTDSAVPIANENWKSLNHPHITSLDQLSTAGELEDYEIEPSDIAYLQYTSGSTSSPKGVIMTHQNVIHNAMAIESGFSLDNSDVVVSWLPHHHDQGLVGIILTGLMVGIPVVLMAPVAFLQNPFCWLHAISNYRGTYSGGPNFGFSYCVEKYTEDKCKGLDLSSWKVAFNGAEPIRSDTLDDFSEVFSKVGFSAKALAPCYGLSEATLAVSLNPTEQEYLRLRVDQSSLEQRQWKLSESGVELISSGEICGEQTAVIVDPEHLIESAPNHIGEIWVSGPSVAMGYWENPEQTNKSMGRTLPNYPGHSFLRTGDLGYIHNGNLFVAGRIKDVIIIRGRNHYPQDIELTVNQSSEVFRASGCAAFSCEIQGEQRLIVVQEIERVAIKKFNPIETRQKVIKQIALKHDIKVHQVVFISPVSLPKTSSGKVQRSLTKQKYIENSLNIIKEQRSDINIDVNSSNSQSKLGVIASEIHGEPVDLNLSLLALGFDSLEIIRFKQKVESQLLATIPLEILFENVSILELESRLHSIVNESLDINTSQKLDVDEFRMSENQKSLWLAQRMQPHSGIYNLAIPLVLHGIYDKNTLNDAWQTCLQRHSLLSMSIECKDELVRFIPAKKQNQIIFYDNHSTLTNNDISLNIRKLAQHPPDLHEPELAKLHCWQRNSSSMVLSFIIHHILVDMWSLLNLLDEFLKLLSGKSLNKNPVAFHDFVAYSKREASQVKADINYWKEKFHNASSEVLRLPGNGMRPEKRSGHANSIYFDIGLNETNELKSIAQQYGTTLHTLLLAIYGMVMMRFSGQSEINIGGPTFGREDARYNSTIGFFVNTVVYQLNLEAGLPFSKYLENIIAETRQVFKHQNTSFSDIVKNSNISSKPGIHPLYQASFTLQKSHHLTEATPMIINGPKSKSFSIHGQNISTFPMPQHSCQVDIALNMVESSGALSARLDYSTDVLSSEQVTQLASGLKQVLCQIPYHMSCATDLIAIQSKPSPITENSPPNSKLNEFVSVIQSLKHSTLTFAKQTAVISQKDSYSYQQIGQWSERLAGHLNRLKVSQGDVVALSCSRDSHWVSALLAIWQIGAIYVPIDNSLPPNRIIDILDQIKPKLVLTEDDSYEFITNKTTITHLLSEEVEPAPIAEILSDDPAYIIFTSGTTGQPKGAVVNHGSLTNRLKWLTNNIPLLKSERVLHKTPTSFDVSLWELLWPLYSGATCVIADDSQRAHPAKLTDLIHEYQVTTAQFVPSFLSVFIDYVKEKWPHNLTRIICGGEELKHDLVDKIDLDSGLELHNLYGPTETGFITHNRIINREDTQNLGNSIDETNVLILDSDDRPTPLGVAGEIVILGHAVGLGYINQSQAQNQFGLTHTGVRYYRTGDTAMYMANNQIKFLGRNDRQIKLRGFRIELSEIESVILKHPDVIAAHSSKVGENAKGQLFTWVHTTNSELTEDLVQWCNQYLPTYMLPDQIILMDQWPLTKHGKLNTHELPIENKNIHNNSETPVGETEQILADIWCDLLNLNQIHRETNFFLSGGHSLLAAIMANRVKEKFGVMPDVQLIFKEPQLRQYAKALTTLTPQNLTIVNKDDQQEEFLI